MAGPRCASPADFCAARTATRRRSSPLPGSAGLGWLASLFFACLIQATPLGAQTVPADFIHEVVASGFQRPVGLAFLPDGRVLVVDQATSTLSLLDGAMASEIVKVPNVKAGGEQGLLGVAVDPAWPVAPYLYVHYTAQVPAGVRVSRFTAAGNLDGMGFGGIVADTGSRFDLLAGIRDSSTIHNGGTLRFGPDGMLYVSIGDDYGFCVAQDTSWLNGKILRLDVSGLPSGPGGPPPRGDLAPADNPFASSSDESARLVWAYGLRNPFRFDIDPTTGVLVIGDVGDVIVDEIDIADQGGLDFGWPWVEGWSPVFGCPIDTIPLTPPIYVYGTTTLGRRALIQGPRYRGGGASAAFPVEYEGDIFYADFYSGKLVRLQESGGTWSVAAPVAGQPQADAWGTGFDRCTDFLVGPDGAIWTCRWLTGQIARIRYSPGVVSVPGPITPGIPTPLYFDIQGRRVDRPSANGVTFVRERDGTHAKKVVIR